jgi:hypothetical protein
MRFVTIITIIIALLLMITCTSLIVSATPPTGYSYIKIGAVAELSSMFMGI